MRNGIKTISLQKLGILLTAFILFTSINSANAVQTSAQNQDLSASYNKKENNVQPIDYENFLKESNKNNYNNITPSEEQLSSIEKSFLLEEIKQNEPALKQIGYDIFQNSSSQGIGKFTGNYKLSIGEKLKVYLWGDSVDMMSLAGSSAVSPQSDAQVDTNGNLFVPGVGIVKAEGRALSEVENALQGLVRQKFTSARVKITMGNSTEFSVFVYGFVTKPGKVEVSNNSSIIEALTAAGGISKNGSLRTIKYKSDGITKTIDLYDLILKGKNIDINLKPNDKIYVSSIGNVIAFKNGVKNPGIYEIKANETASTIMSYAGGLLPSTDSKIANIKSYDTKLGQRSSKDVNKSIFNKAILSNGDILEFKNLYSEAEDFVEIQGNVKHPGIFQYKKGMRLSDVLPSKSELKTETFIQQAVIKRTVGSDNQVKSMAVSLDSLFNGSVDPKLEPKDIIVVYKGTNVNYIEVYGCINNPKTVPYNDKLTMRDILANIQFMTAGSVQNVSNKDNKDANNEKNTLLIKTNSDKNGVRTLASINNTKNTGITSNNIIYSPSDIAVEITNSNEKTSKVFYLYDVLVKEDITSNIIINENDKILFRPLRDGEMVKTVKISGYVNNPGVYKFIKGTKLSEVLIQAGDLSEDANLRGIVYKRPSIILGSEKIISDNNQREKKTIEGALTSSSNLTNQVIDSQKVLLDSLKNNENQTKMDGRIILDIKGNDLNKLSSTDDILVQDGDEIYIPRKSNHITILGEVYNPSTFVYVSNRNAQYYIDNVGGLTTYAKKSRIYKVGSNGKAYKIASLRRATIDAGDTIIVPRKITNNWIENLKSTIQLATSVLSSVYILTKI
ncbi:MAG: SLBB domain-containing protein [Candidatus Gastranaerophilaceae bacterium]|jgi:protein involved in polysaccharide export with SLBB domain